MADFNLGTSLTQNWDARGRVFYTDENGNKVDLNTPFLERVGNRLRKGFGTALQGASFLPIFNVPYVGTGLGGAMFEAGNAIREGRPGEDIAKDAAKGFVIGETVGAIPYVGKGINKLSGGKIGNVVDDIGRQLANTKAGQTVTNYAKQAETSLNNAIEKAEDFINTKFKNKQTAYHGSPYDFAKFSNKAIGAGEGAQAHGMGHYAAKSKGVADEYRVRLTKEKGGGAYPVTYKGKKIDDDTPLGKVIENIIYEKEKNFGLIDLKEAQENYINTLEKDLNATGFLADMRKEWANERLPIAKEINIDDIIQNKGQLYKLSIPKDDVMLREDLPFSQQPKAVQDGLENYFKDLVALNKGGFQAGKTLVTPVSEEQLLRDYIYNNGDGSPLGIYMGLADRKKTFHELHKDPISSNYAQQQITNDLSDYGIKGISYNGGIDGEARVIFNPDDIEIVRKYYNQPNLYDYLMKNPPNIGTVTSAIEDI